MSRARADRAHPRQQVRHPQRPGRTAFRPRNRARSPRQKYPVEICVARARAPKAGHFFARAAGRWLLMMTWQLARCFSRYSAILAGTTFTAIWTWHHERRQLAGPCARLKC